MTPSGRDRVRELLDAVLGEQNDSLAGMASDAYASEYHFGRQVSRCAGESPMAIRRRVMLERAAWYLRRGHRVTDVAFDSGYSSVEGFSRAFSRAFGHPPSAVGVVDGHRLWLPAPNGIHFHSPTVLYVDSTAQPGPGRSEGPAEPDAGDALALMIRHDVADIGLLIEATGHLDESAYRRVRMPGNHLLRRPDPDDSIAHVLAHLVLDKLPWLASIDGEDHPDLGTDSRADLVRSNAEISARWLALIRDIDRRGAWSDRVIDALCDPPESFVLAEIVAHVLTFSAHRRLLLRMMLRDAGVDVDAGASDPDPIMWHRNHSGRP